MFKNKSKQFVPNYDANQDPKPQKQKGILKNKQVDPSRVDIQQHTASFGTPDYSYLNELKNNYEQQEIQYYKRLQEKKYNLLKQKNEMQISEEFKQDNRDIQSVTFNQTQISLENEQKYYLQQNPNEYNFNDKGYNENTLQQQQLQDDQQQNEYRQQSNSPDKSIQKSDSRIYMYLQNMVDQTKSISESDKQIFNLISSESLSPEKITQNNIESNQQYFERKNPPQPEVQPSTYNEKAYLKQKQRQAQLELIKESKQKKVLNQIAHFYRQLANKKQQEEQEQQQQNEDINSRSQSKSQSPIKYPESHSQIQKNSKKKLKTYKPANLKSKNDLKLASSHSNTHQISQTGVVDQLQSQSENNQIENEHQIKSTKTSKQERQKLNAEMSQSGSYKTQKLKQMENKQKTKSINSYKQQSKKFDEIIHLIKQNDEQNITFSDLITLTSNQFEFFQSKLKNQDYYSEKSIILQKYKQIESKLKYFQDQQNYQSSISESLHKSKFKYGFRYNPIKEFKFIRKISQQFVYEGIKEIIKLKETYIAMTKDIQALEIAKNRKRNTRAVTLSENNDQKLQIIKDMQMRLTQKVFFIYICQVQKKYKKYVQSQLISFEHARNKIRLLVAINSIKHYSYKSLQKNQLFKMKLKDLQYKKMKRIFQAIKDKGKKYVYYKPFACTIRDNHKNILKQNSFLSLFDYSLKQKTKRRKLELCSKIYDSHIFTKSFLILKAFRYRKSNKKSIQTMKVKNMSIEYINELFECNNSYQQSKYNKQKSFIERNKNLYISNKESTKIRQREKNNFYIRNEIVDMNSSQGLNDREQNNQLSKYDEMKRKMFDENFQVEEFECSDQSYDSKQFQKHFYCEEQFLTSARILLESKRQMTLNKLDRLKQTYAQSEEQSSFLQKNKEKVQELNRAINQEQYEKSLKLNSDSKLNLIQIPDIQNNKQYRQQEYYYDQQINETDESRIGDQVQCKSIIILEQHIKQIIRVLKKFSKKKEYFQNKKATDLLLKEDSFFYSPDQSLSYNDDILEKQQLSQKIHPLREHQEMIKRIEQEEKKNKCNYMFYHWKIVFLERTLSAEISLLSSLKRCKKVLQAFKTRFRINNEICQLQIQAKEEKLKINIFNELALLSTETRERNQQKLDYFQTKMCFKRIYQFSASRKIKRIADNFYFVIRQKSILQQWAKISRDNSEIRQRYKISLSKRYFRCWKQQISKKHFLQRFWKKILYSPEEILYEKYGNKSNQLLAMIKEWREVVIENENTMKQKLASKSAIQHRQVVLKTKAFFQWIKCIKIQQGLAKLFESHFIKSRLRQTIIQPWKEAVAHQKLKILTFQHKINKRILFKGFQCLKARIKQKNIAKNFFSLKFFKVWKQQSLQNQIFLPNNFYHSKLLKVSFTSMILFQLKAIRTRSKLEKSTRFFLYHIKNFMTTCMQLWNKYSKKRKSKKLLKIKLSKYADRNLKKKCFLSFKHNRNISRLRVVQNQKALEFKAFQYQKKYNLQQIMNDPHLNSQLQDILTILHHWKAYTIKQKNIKFIQSRIQKFHNRKTLIGFFNLWQKKYNDQIFLQIDQKDHSENKSDINKNVNNKSQSISSSIKNTIQIHQDKYHHKNQLSNQSQTSERTNFMSFQQNNKDIIQQDQKELNYNQSNSNKLHTYPSSIQADNNLKKAHHPIIIIPDDAQGQRSPTFQSSQSRSSKSPSSLSNSPTYGKGSLKTNLFHDHYRKNRKSVRFELNSSQQQNYPTALVQSKIDYFDQKYNENEAFYAKLLEQKRLNTSQF